MNRTLNEITQAYSDLLLQIDDAEGVVDDDILAELDGAEFDLADKVERCLSLAQSMAATARAEKDRAAKVLDHARAMENASSRLLEWVKVNLEAVGLTKIEAGTYTAKIAKVGPSANVDDMVFMLWAQEQGRDDLITVKPAPDPAPNKREILAALKRGDEIKGAELITGRTRLAVQ